MKTIEITLAQQSNTAVKTTLGDYTIHIDRPVEKGGGGQGLMGGQYMLIGVGGCYCSTLFAAAQSRNIEIHGVEAHVKAQLSEDLPSRFTHITIEIAYQYCSHPRDIDKLLSIAEKGCISVNTVRQGVIFQVESAEK